MAPLRLHPLLVVAALAGCSSPGGSGDGGAVPDLILDGARPRDASAIDFAVIDSAMPDSSMPDLSMPDLSMPDLSMPDLMPPCGAMGQACCVPFDCANGLVCTNNGCAAAIAPAQCPNGSPPALFVAESAPPAMLAPGTRGLATVTFANCSGAAWQKVAINSPTGFKLGPQSPQDNDTWIGTTRIALPADVPPNTQVTVPIVYRAPALTGPWNWSWGIVHEGVAWVPSYSPVHSIDVEASARTVTLCNGVTADAGGVTPASAAIQQCIDATPAGGTLDLPAGIYRMDGAVTISRAITLRTAGTQGQGSTGCLDFDGPACAVLRADDKLNVPRGFLLLAGASKVTLDHLLLDGNRGRRSGSAAAMQCAQGNNGPGFNASTPGGCVNCTFNRGGSARALCGTGFEWDGDGITVTDSTFRDNGDHATTNMWSDGFTIHQSANAVVTGNRFIDNSDVDLIFGGAPGAVVKGNLIRQQRQSSFAGLMLDNFNAGTSGDYTGAVVANNSIVCVPQLCDFGIMLGPHPWYLSKNIIGGTVMSNTVSGGKFGINAEGAGTVNQPMVVKMNTVDASPATASFNCGVRAATAFNASPDSHLDVTGGPAPTGSMTFHGCP